MDDITYETLEYLIELYEYGNNDLELRLGNLDTKCIKKVIESLSEDDNYWNDWKSKILQVDYMCMSVESREKILYSLECCIQSRGVNKKHVYEDIWNKYVKASKWYKFEDELVTEIRRLQEVEQPKNTEIVHVLEKTPLPIELVIKICDYNNIHPCMQDLQYINCSTIQ